MIDPRIQIAIDLLGHEDTEVEVLLPQVHSEISGALHELLMSLANVGDPSCDWDSTVAYSALITLCKVIAPEGEP